MPSSKSTSRSDVSMDRLICSREGRTEVRTTASSWKGRVLWLLAVAVVLALPAWGAELPDAGRGRLLYENHCVVCHTSRVHRRAAPLPMNLEELRGIVAGWARDQKLNWSDGEISDVVEYLDSTYYRMLGR